MTHTEQWLAEVQARLKTCVAALACGDLHLGMMHELLDRDLPHALCVITRLRKALAAARIYVDSGYLECSCTEDHAAGCVYYEPGAMSRAECQRMIEAALNDDGRE